MKSLEEVAEVIRRQKTQHVVPENQKVINYFDYPTIRKVSEATRRDLCTRNEVRCI